ncbi:hypothetical protein FKN04_23245 [Bacillus glycinifermentans]|uniref:hypothetical protein n=1 Tax=Bacillus glycinifermentans TaxID=1664069 RepID=UPI00158235F1|nr:hypothetical protein [Bacillus glycinifermentans]NUJ19450.1 hypothetical protein [Bacillus glycinifermentans]
MKTIEITPESVVQEAIKNGQKIMGDGFIGYKFVYEGSTFWNSLLKMLFDQGYDVSKILSTEWLTSNEIEAIPYDSKIWTLH